VVNIQVNSLGVFETDFQENDSSLVFIKSSSASGIMLTVYGPMFDVFEVFILPAYRVDPKRLVLYCAHSFFSGSCHM
jgi:hypothetical protein